MQFFRNIRNFFNDVVAEFKRVSWPTPRNTLQSTAVVMVVTVAVAIFLGVVDLGLSSTIKLIIK